MATTAGTPYIVTFSICLARFWAPSRTASTFSSSSAGSSGLPATILPTPPCILSARTVATTTAASGLRPDARHLMSKNFSAPMSAPKPASVHDDVVGHQGKPVGDDRVVAVGDVGERPGVDEGRPALERLEQVRLDRVAQQDRHRAGDVEVLGGDRLAVGRRRQDDPAEPGAQVEQVGGEGEDRHHLGADRDDVLGLARDAVLAPAEADDDVAQRAVADVDDARPEDPVRVDPERVLVVEAVVDEGARPGCGRHRWRGRRRSGGG